MLRLAFIPTTLFEMFYMTNCFTHKLLFKEFLCCLLALICPFTVAVTDFAIRQLTLVTL